MNAEDLRRRYEALVAIGDDADKAEKQQRGREFERLLGAALDAEGLSPRLNFRPVGEEIDGIFSANGQLYLLEAKWRGSPLPASEIYAFQGKLNGKLEGTRGVFISASGFAPDAPEALVKGKRLNVILWGRDELDALFRIRATFAEILEEKLRAAAEKGEVYFVVRPKEPQRKFRRGFAEAMRELREERAEAMIKDASGRRVESVATLEDASRGFRRRRLTLSQQTRVTSKHKRSNASSSRSAASR